MQLCGVRKNSLDAAEANYRVGLVDRSTGNLNLKPDPTNALLQESVSGHFSSADHGEKQLVGGKKILRNDMCTVVLSKNRAWRNPNLSGDCL